MFGAVKPSRTHSKLPLRPASPFITVVRGGSGRSNRTKRTPTFPVRSNRPKLTRTFLVGLLPPTAQWFEDVRCRRTFPNSLQTALEARFTLHPCFEEVRCSRTSPNSLQTALQASFPLQHSGSSGFGVVEPPRTHSNLPCRPASPFVTVVRGGSVGSTYPKRTPTFPVGLFPPLLQCFEKVRCLRTSPNSLEPSL